MALSSFAPSPSKSARSRKKSGGPFGKSRCWQCGQRDIWKRTCETCAAKFCAGCIRPGPALKECELCEKILKEPSKKSLSLLTFFGNSFRTRLNRTKSGASTKSDVGITCGESDEKSFGRSGCRHSQQGGALEVSRSSRRVMCETQNMGN